MDLKEIIDTREDQEPIWVAYPDSKTFKVFVRPLGDRQDGFLKKSRDVKWDEAAMEQKVVFSEDTYRKEFGSYVIADWKGLHVEDLKRLVLLKSFRKIKKFKGAIACDEGSKTLLVKHSPSFWGFINRVTTDIERFNREREEAEEKNS